MKHMPVLWSSSLQLYNQIEFAELNAGFQIDWCVGGISESSLEA